MSHIIEKIDSNSSESDSEPELKNIGRDSHSPNPERFISNLSESQTSGPSNNITTMIQRRPGEARTRLSARPPVFPQPNNSTSESSDSEDDANSTSNVKVPEGVYNPKLFENLQVSTEISNLFDHIMRYTPQKIDMEYRLKPFIPEFIPAVGDTDAFLKVITPEFSWLGEPFNDTNQLQLGLEVLDEPSANQSDSALLFLQLRATEKTKKTKTPLNVKKIQDTEKNPKAIDQWINDISDLHGTHPPPKVIYKNPMPDIDSLLQDWPQEEAEALKNGFPNHQMNCTLEQYIELVCSIFDIPVYESRIESLHVLFSMCMAIKNYYMYLNTNDTENDNLEIMKFKKNLNTKATFEQDSDNEHVIID